MTDPGRRKIRVILNPNAGQKAGVQTSQFGPDDILALMEQHGLGSEMVVTTCEEDATEATQDAVARGYDAVVGVGGDGTVGCIARELIGSATALGVVPGGSVMNIARMIGLPRELDAAFQTIAAGHTRKIDVGEANGQLFFEAASVGLNAPVFEAGQRFDAGEYQSILQAIWVAIRYRPARMAIRLDDGTIVTRALIVTVANGAYTGMGFTVAPAADPGDGVFDISVFRRFSRTGLLLHFGRIAFGRKSYSPKVTTHRSRAVHISSVHPLPCRADSFDLGMTPVTFVCQHAALNIITPDPDAVAANE
ncbi:diacylglycerol kinase family lipid kinase [soil metagenome]